MSSTDKAAEGVWAEVSAADGTMFRAFLVAPRSGRGPGLLVLHGAAGLTTNVTAICRRFAEEGYAVLAPDLSRHATATQALNDVFAARVALAPYLEAAAKTGAVAIAEGGAIGWRLALGRAVDALVIYGATPALGADGKVPACPVAIHVAGHAAPETVALRTRLSPQSRVHEYPESKHHFFDPQHFDYEPHAASIAYTRSLAILRPVLGPHYDLSRLFDEHLKYEFIEHDADATMETMVGEPYVNHVPTLTGGVGHDMLKRFYKYHFIPNLPSSRRSILLSETVGPDIVIRETVTIFQHTEEIDYLLPGIKPTGKQLEVATVVIAKFRGDKLYHEHIYWDQASLLAQLGLIDDKTLPVAGAAAARKMLDQSLPANELMARWKESEGKPL